MLIGHDEARTYVGPVYRSRPEAEAALAALRLGPGSTGHVVYAIDRLTAESEGLTIARARTRRGQ